MEKSDGSKMSCEYCKKPAQYKAGKNLICSKICLINLFGTDNTLTFEFLLRIEPLELINTISLNRKIRDLIFTITFFKTYVKRHKIPDEFMWWIITLGNKDIIFIVKQSYKGFFSDNCTSDRWLEKTCQTGRLDLLTIIFKYGTVYNQKVLKYQAIVAAQVFNLNVFNILYPHIKPTSGFADIVMNKIYAFTDERQLPAVRGIFFKIFIYVSTNFLDRSVFYLMRQPDLLKFIFQRIPVTDLHIVDIIYNIPREEVLTYVKMILQFGKPASLEESLRSAVVAENQELYRFLKQI